MQYTLGFIGCGNMGGALARAAAKAIGGQNIALCDHSQEKAAALANELGASVLSARELAQNSHFIVLGVKPQSMQLAVAEFSDILRTRENAVIITMAAGLSIDGLRSLIGANLPIIRIMPNTPVQLGKGMTLYAVSGVSLTDEQAFLNAFALSGALDKLDERLIDAAAGVSGSGPAFVYAFAQALSAGAAELGVPQEKAEKYAAQTLLGAAEMLLAYGDAEKLKKAVCSPKGTTLAGLEQMEKHGFENAAKAGVKGAYKRTLELKQ